MPAENNRLERDLGKLIDSLDLPARQEQYLRGRWLDQVVWMSRAAGKARQRYYGLRLVTVLGAVVIPGLVSLNLTGNAESAVNWLTFSVSLLVAASAAVEAFFHFGARWRHYRGTVERLKSEGWTYAELSGPYNRRGAAHENTFQEFVSRVEQTLGQESQAYIEGVVAEAGAQRQQS